MLTDTGEMDALQIREALPHRYPFLLIDRVTACVPGESITAVKNVSLNEPFFQGHFPKRPVMPGVLIIEAMAQAGGVLSHVTHESTGGQATVSTAISLAGVASARFRRTVLPGDQLIVQVEVDKVKRGIWFYDCRASVGDKLAVEAQITCAPGGER